MKDSLEFIMKYGDLNSKIKTQSVAIEQLME